MSYILDALRKADAERERGNVPGINAQPMFAAPAARSTPRDSTPWWIWLVATVAIVLGLVVAALLWTLNGNESRSSVEPTRASAASVPMAVTGASMPAAAPSAVTAQVQPGADATKVAPRGVPVTRKPKPVDVGPKPSAQGAATASNSVGSDLPAATPRSQSQVQGRSAAAPASASGESHVYTMNELPDDIRRQLPALAVGASIYSATPANRILIINGQVLHEGEAVISGLVLEQIKLKAAVLAFKGFRFIITY
jgi:general secretion pathway protein B